MWELIFAFICWCFYWYLIIIDILVKHFYCFFEYILFSVLMIISTDNKIKKKVQKIEIYSCLKKHKTFEY